MQQIVEKAIEGKVAEVLNQRELVINRGSEHGVESGMRFEVIEESEEFHDPDTDEVLGSITRSKIRVRVSDVQPRFSIARTYETYQVREPSSWLSVVPRTLTKVKTISKHDEEYPDSAYERAQSLVEIGDKVVQIP